MYARSVFINIGKCPNSRPKHTVNHLSYITVHVGSFFRLGLVLLFLSLWREEFGGHFKPGFHWKHKHKQKQHTQTHHYQYLLLGQKTSLNNTLISLHMLLLLMLASLVKSRL